MCGGGREEERRGWDGGKERERERTKLAAVWRWCMQMIDDFTAGLDNSSKQIWLWGGDQYECARVYACLCLSVHVFELPLFMLCYCKQSIITRYFSSAECRLYVCPCIRTSTDTSLHPLLTSSTVSLLLFFSIVLICPQIDSPHIDWSALQNHFMERLFNWFRPSHARISSRLSKCCLKPNSILPNVMTEC